MGVIITLELVSQSTGENEQQQSEHNEVCCLDPAERTEQQCADVPTAVIVSRTIGLRK